MPTKVLVVDDEIDTLNLLKTILEISGFEPIPTLNSLDAMTLAVIEKPDMALLDIMMPNLDGFTLCQMIRRNPHTENLPVVFVTAYPALDLEDRRRDAGADYILHKPINIDLLIDTINNIQKIREKNLKENPPKSKALEDASLREAPETKPLKKALSGGTKIEDRSRPIPPSSPTSSSSSSPASSAASTQESKQVRLNKNGSADANNKPANQNPE